MVWFLGTNNVAVTTKLKQVKLEWLLERFPIWEEDAATQVNNYASDFFKLALKIVLF
jgi:hypothetical protein